MKIVRGNSYVCLKEWKDTEGRKIFAGTICYGGKSGLLYGYNSDKIYSQVELLDDYSEYFTLYEESPYNKERRELRERYAGLAMQALLSSHYKEFIETSEKIGEPEEVIVASTAIDFANALIEELRGKEV